MIEAENLTAGYGSKSVLHDVTFSFTGGAAGLLGPNGAGKSTLIKTVLGLIPPMSGRIDVLGKRLPRAAAEVRSRIGYMPETEAFIPGMNAVHFTAYMGQLSGLPRAAAMERAHEVLQYVGLGESRYRNLETYSTGMKQRAKLAQAIVHDPTLLLLDEPTNGMDPPGRAEMLELVADLSKNKGMSVVLCSHLLHDVETVANEIIVMGNGRIAARRMKLADTGDRERIYSVRVRGSREAFVSALQEFGIPATNLEDGANLLFKLPAGSPTRSFFLAAAKSDCVVQRLEEQTEKLEDLFVKTIGELGHANL